MNHRLAFIGFGVVGQGCLDLLIAKQAKLKEDLCADFSIVSISDKLKGSIHDSKGLDLVKLREHLAQNGNLMDFPCETPGWNSLETIERTNASVIVELSYTDIESGEPALTHIRAALTAGKHVVTTNKGPIALAYAELDALAREKGVQIKFEGTVMSGTPVLNLATHCLAGTEVVEIKGILNGTTNYILCEMEKGMSYDDALKQAQELGYAEACPDSDVKGLDALAKTAILAQVVMGVKLDPSDIPCTGITEISSEDIGKAKEEGCRYKLIASLKKQGGKVVASVSPEKLPLADPLSSVSGATNAITYVTDALGATTIVGAGAGKTETGYAVLVDLLEIHCNEELASGSGTGPKTE